MKSYEKLEILRAAVCVVGVDGQVGPEEKVLIEKLAGAIGVGLASREAMIDRAKSDQDFWQEMFGVLKTSPVDTMLILFQAALADGEVSESESSVLQRFAERLGISEEEFVGLEDTARRTSA